MIKVKAYCSGIVLYPTDSLVHESLKKILMAIDGFDFEFQVDDPNVNQGQMKSNFDTQLEQAILSQGAFQHLFDLPKNIPQKLDFAFRYNKSIVAVEVEKTNREKILRDILKAHMYLHSGADFALLALPKNYPHSGGIWNLYEFGKQRFLECQTYGFGTEERLNRIILLGFEQFDTQTQMPLDVTWRKKVRQMAKGV
jgi:hypothetical protein